VLKDERRIGPNELKLLDFPKRLGLQSHEDTKRWGRFGALFNFKPKVKTGAAAIPKNFIDFIMTNFKDKPALQITSEFSYQMEKGINPVVVEGFMMHGSKDAALRELIKHIDRSRPPQSNDRFFQLVIKSMLQRRLEWIENEMNTASNFIRKEWAIVRDLLSLPQHIDSEMPEIDFPKPIAVYLDNEITPEYVLGHHIDKIPLENWIMTWVLCLEAFLFGVAENSGDYGQFIRLDGFLYHNAVASNNTLFKIKDILLDKENTK
jgi:hypothetical protein